MIHRYNGVHRWDKTYSWCCTCGADGATRWDTVAAAKQSYLRHQRHEAATAAVCEWCTAVTDEPGETDDGFQLCSTCLLDSMPPGEAAYAVWGNL